MGNGGCTQQPPPSSLLELIIIITMTIELAQQGCRQAHEELYTENQHLVKGVLIRMGIRQHEIDDLMQEVFLQVWKSIVTLEDPLKFQAWVAAISRNKASNYKRRQAKKKAQNFIPDIEDDDVHLFEIEDVWQVQSAMQELRDFDRHTLEAYFFDGLTVKEMSEAFQVPEGTIKRRLNVAKKRLKQIIEEGETK